MIQHQIKLRLKSAQEDQLNDWLFMLTGVWNFAVRKIELDAKRSAYRRVWVERRVSPDPFRVCDFCIPKTREPMR
jgi:hypothetical protein